MSNELVKSLLQENELLRKKLNELARANKQLQVEKDEATHQHSLEVKTLSRKLSQLERRLLDLPPAPFQPIGLERNSTATRERNTMTISINSNDDDFHRDTDAVSATSSHSERRALRLSTLPKPLPWSEEGDPELLTFCFEVAKSIAFLNPESYEKNESVFGVRLFSLFSHEMGASSLIEVLSAVTEHDLIRFGIPLVKARLIMNAIIEKGSETLNTMKETKRLRRRSSVE